MSGGILPREDIFWSPMDVSKYEAAEDAEFYTSSTACRLGRVYSDTSLIEPSWSRISVSPWGEAAKVCGGYGRRIVNGSTSKDAPEFMCSKVINRIFPPRLYPCSFLFFQRIGPFLRRNTRCPTILLMKRLNIVMWHISSKISLLQVKHVFVCFLGHAITT